MFFTWFGAFMEHCPFQRGDDGQFLKNELSWSLDMILF